MKKLIITCLFFIAFIAAKAQLANTQWKGTIEGDETIDVVFRFGNDTLTVVNTGDASTIEVLTYTTKDSSITFKKVYGQSECDETTVGQYKYSIKNNELTYTLIKDDCDQRMAVLNNSKWTKVE